MHARTAAKPLALLAALLMTVGLAACGDDDDTSAGTSDDVTSTAPADGGDGGDAGGAGGAGDAGAEEVTIVAEDFSLTSVTAEPGEAVHLDNQGDKPHTVTADDGAFDTGNTAPGAQSEFAAPMEPGTYAYHCAIHPNMTGTLTVSG